MKFIRLAVWLIFIACAIGAAVTISWIGMRGKELPFSFSRILSIILIPCGLSLCNIMVRWIKWRFLYRRSGMRIVAKNDLIVYLVTLPALLTPFYLGELIRIPLLGQSNRWGFSTLLRVFLLERGADVLVLIAMTFAGHPIIILLIGSLVVCSLCFRPVRAAGWGAAVGLSALAWTFPVISLKLILLSLSLNVDWTTCFRVFAGGTLFGGISGVPMGAGVTGSIMLNMLVNQGLAQQTAGWSVLILRSGTVWFSLILGILSCVFFFRYRKKKAGSHFDAIAHQYESEIPEHVRSILLDRKVTAVCNVLSPGTHKCGLDTGCGQGTYVISFARKGFDMTGLDLSAAQLKLAEQNAENAGVKVEWSRGSATSLPFDDNSFDFVYAVNMIHHLPDRKSQIKALHEMGRVLRPDGYIFIHEMNPKNPVFRFYISYIFPIIKAIDEGTEWWLDSRELPEIDGGNWDKDIYFFTFLPDFIPKWMWRLLHGIELRCEKSRFRSFSAHFMAVWKKSAGRLNE